MNYTHPDRSRLRRVIALQAALALAATTAWAQVASPTEAKPEQSKPASAEKVPTKAEVTAAGDNDTTLAKDDKTVILSPFQVNPEKDRGYHGASTMSGTRLGADLDDLANPITIVTKQQLDDFAMRDINDIFASELSVEGTRTFTANGNDGKADVDAVALSPETANRVRGLGAANISLGNYGKSSTIPIDTYNIDAVEISRGPNSSIFGMGEASGTVNLVPSAANLALNITRTSLSYSSYGTGRATIDLNRPIIKGKLAVRLNALQEEKGFIRKPSFDKTRRYQISVTAQPFQYTTIRASYENFRERFSRPNSMTATDFVSLWKQMGSPSWNPFTNTWSYKAYTNPVNGISYAGGTGLLNPNSNNSDTNNYYNGTTTGTPAIGPLPPAGALWLAGFGSTRVRPVMFIDQGQVQWAGTEFWTNASAAANNNRHELVAFALPANYNVPAQYVGTLPYRGMTASTDQSFYDYESLSLAGLNRGAKDAGTTRVELEQFILRTPIHTVAVQLGLFQEQITETSRNFVGNGGDGVALNILPDVNLTLPDGTPNPRYGAPYMSALAPQTYVKPINTKTYRANAVYQLDLSKQKSFLRFLGSTKVLGYAESFDKVYAKNSLRYQDQIIDVLNPWYNNSIRNNNDGKFLTRYYVGDANGGNIDYGSSGLPETLKITYNRYGSRAASAATATNPAFPAERTGWYALTDVNMGPAYFSQGKQNVQTTTRGFILQNYLFNNRVITTWGRRRDTLRTRETGTTNIARSPLEPASAIDPLSGLSTSLAWLDDFSNSTWNIVDTTTGRAMSVGYTDNKGIVVKALPWLNLRYNQSTSFKPEDFAIDFQQNPLPNSRGQSKDYGFTLNLFDNKLNIGLTRYDTFAKDSRNNDINVVARRITNLDYDLVFGSNGSGFDLEDWYRTELLTSRGLVEGASTGTLISATPEQVAAALADTHTAMGLTDARIAYTRDNAPAITSDRRAKGYELSIDYNPTQFLSLKFNGSRSETIYTNFGRTWTDYKNERMPIWTTIKSPNSGLRWWDQTTFSGTTPAQSWLGLNEAPMKVNLALDGKPVPQNAKYRFNLLGRYRLAGMFPNTNFLKNTSIGGKFSWIDKTGIGFYGAAPEADGLVREYNPNRPIWYKAQTYVDLFATYDFRLYKDRIKGSVQLNVRNVGESGHLQPYAANPDGKYYNYRIVDPREFILSVNFEL